MNGGLDVAVERGEGLSRPVAGLAQGEREARKGAGTPGNPEEALGNLSPVEHSSGPRRGRSWGGSALACRPGRQSVLDAPRWGRAEGWLEGNREGRWSQETGLRAGKSNMPPKRLGGDHRLAHVPAAPLPLQVGGTGKCEVESRGI